MIMNRNRFHLDTTPFIEDTYVYPRRWSKRVIMYAKAIVGSSLRLWWSSERDIRINRLCWLIDLKLKINVHDAVEMRSDGNQQVNWVWRMKRGKKKPFVSSEKWMCSVADKKGSLYEEYQKQNLAHNANKRFMIDRLGAFFYSFIFYYAFLLFIRSSFFFLSRLRLPPTLLIIFINRFRFPLYSFPP